MAELIETRAVPAANTTVVETSADIVGPARQAYRILHFGFVAAPTLAGLDKFAHLLTNWDQYLAPQVSRLSPIGGHNLMLVVGVVEILAGLLVALRPRIGGYVVAAWLAAIIGNLLLGGHFYDIALRDFGLLLGAASLARLASVFDHRTVKVPARARAV